MHLQVRGAVLGTVLQVLGEGREAEFDAALNASSAESGLLLSVYSSLSCVTSGHPYRLSGRVYCAHTVPANFVPVYPGRRRVVM